MSALEVRGVACARGATRLFRDVSFALMPGEWIAVRGPNGCGKTTLLRCTAGLTSPEAGDVLWDGRDTRQDPGPFRAQLLYAGHAAGIKDDLTALENLRDALALRAACPGSDALRGTLAQVGLDRHRHLPARRLSAGQRRRIGLARLALDPAMLWALDEPLTALDDAGQSIFTNLLETHLARGGCALVATHHEIAPAPTRELRLSP